MKQICHLMLFAGAALACFALGSCNTFIGMGRDIENLGEGMQNKSEGKTWYGERGDNAQPAPAPPSPEY